MPTDATALPEGPLIPAEEVPFLQSGLAMGASSCDAALRPSTGRVLACRISADRRRFTAILCASRCPDLLRDIRATGKLAVISCQVGINRSLQLKGTDAHIGAIEPQDLGLLAAQTSAFAADVVHYDALPEEMIRAYIHFEVHDLVAVSFTPAAVFLQTPGPAAGTLIA
ncbi:hypothetical protein [Niveibacterium sp. SC-1]|uniref:hypothetical protein n=1 Tax=Niveibacterium sp. SC-1 TaxID=3135646 RepID=UPI00311FF0F3